ncbi:hypothetical protein PCE1_002002 [Barthelona sp. PCE]
MFFHRELTPSEIQPAMDLFHPDMHTLEMVECVSAFHRLFLRNKEGFKSALSFNGGKDCTVLLHIASKMLPLYDMTFKDFPVCFFDTHDQFPEVQEFIEATERDYDYEIITYTGSFKDIIKQSIDDLALESMVLGVRVGDPSASTMDIFCESTANWPKILRVGPILNFSYEMIWNYIKNHNVSYCSLYDDGYTSLGSPHNTKKNPQLFDNKTNTYLPAHMLQNGVHERESRISSRKSS